MSWLLAVLQMVRISVNGAARDSGAGLRAGMVKKCPCPPEFELGNGNLGLRGNCCLVSFASVTPWNGLGVQWKGPYDSHGEDTQQHLWYAHGFAWSSYAVCSVLITCELTARTTFNWHPVLMVSAFGCLFSQGMLIFLRHVRL